MSKLVMAPGWAILTPIPVGGIMHGFKFHSCHSLLAFIPILPCGGLPSCGTVGRHRVQFKLQGKAGVAILTTVQGFLSGARPLRVTFVAHG